MVGMNVIPREVCRNIDQALAHEWLVTNGQGSYAAGTISGALTRREHGLLVARLAPASRVVMLAKLDEEIELEGQVYKLGTNVFQDNVINPDGFLYLQQVTFEHNLPTFWYEAGRFQLSKSVWMEPGQATTYVRYTLGENSAHVHLTLVPFCDFRPTERLTPGGENWHFRVDPLEQGLQLTASEQAKPYALFTEPAAAYTPLDIWYWRFQLRADGNATTDLYVPGLVRTRLKPGGSFTVIATTEAAASGALDAEDAWARAAARADSPPLVVSKEFNSNLFRENLP